MKQKIISSVAILSLLSLAVFVSATMNLNSNGSYDVEIQVREGWNIIAATLPTEGIAPDSEIQLGDIKAAWLYTTKFGELSPSGEYVRAYPNPDMDRINQADDTEMIRNAMWIYVEKNGILKYNTLETYKMLDSRNLWEGWNFFTITPDIIGNSLWEVKGTCNFEDIYAWDVEDKRWSDDINQLERINGNQIAGMGIVVKVSNDCHLSSSDTQTDDDTNPPGLPPGTTPQDSYDTECVDTDGGIDYYTKGATYYGKYDYVESCGRPGTVNAGTPQEYTIVEGDLLEHACYGPDNDKRCSTSACRFIQYHCPNGCKDGACI
tara:strand:- start:147 stop:1106 length:960 start_codon:yes stop_codon:yes gene_type:complete